MNGMGRMIGIGLVALVGAATPDGHAADAAVGWLLRRVVTPGVVQGDVVVADDGSLLVGQGGFGPGGQRIVRIDPAGVTVVADGFGSLGGFSLGDDGTLYVVDNCFEGDFGCDGATTGDTIYAVPDALGRVEPIEAADAELLPAGSIPAAFDVLASPTLGLLVSDAVGPGVGRVLRVTDGAATPLLGGFDFTAGIAEQGDRLLVGSSDADFVGSIVAFQAGVDPGAELVGGLSGVFGVDASARDVFVTGGFTADFASSTVVAVDGQGAVREIASGFAFTGGLHWQPRRETVSVLDFDAREIAVLCEDGNADGACDAQCPAPVPARTRAVLELDPDGGRPMLRLRARLRTGRGPRADPSVTGVAVGVTDADGTVLADWQLPGGPGWQRRRRRWTWRGEDAGGAAEIVVRRRRRRFAVSATGELTRTPTGAFRTSVAVLGTGGSCGLGEVSALAGTSR